MRIFGQWSLIPGILRSGSDILPLAMEFTRSWNSAGTSACFQRSLSNSRLQGHKNKLQHLHCYVTGVRPDTHSNSTMKLNLHSLTQTVIIFKSKPSNPENNGTAGYLSLVLRSSWKRWTKRLAWLCNAPLRETLRLPQSSSVSLTNPSTACERQTNSAEVRRSRDPSC